MSVDTGEWGEIPIVSRAHELLESDVYIDLADIVRRPLYVKCEGFNFGGSLKLRSAAAMVDAAQRNGLLTSDSALVESSSGNLGVALSVIAAGREIDFTCVTDVRCNQTTINLMRALGATVVVVAEPDPVNGFLGARLSRVHALCAAEPRYVWLNQYTNEANWKAHHDLTAPAIAEQFPGLDVVFCGAGTGGTAMGCARYFRGQGKGVRVVAVDSVGSVNFGESPGPRLIPGLGAGVRSPLLGPEVVRDLIDDVVHVPEAATVRTCRALSARGLVLGGSTGTVLSGALDWLGRHDPAGELTAVAISADLGDRYLDTIYNDDWVREHFGADALPPPGRRGDAWPQV